MDRNTATHFREKYKLLEAQGKEIEWDVVSTTEQAGFPYPCANEDEVDALFNGEKQGKRQTTAHSQRG